MDAIRFASNATKIIRESAPQPFAHHQDMEDYAGHYVEVLSILSQIQSGGMVIMTQEDIEALKPKRRKRGG